MSPYEVKLLVHIDSCFDPIPFKRTRLLQDTLLDFYRRGLIAIVNKAVFVNTIEDRTEFINNMCNWKTTKLGRAVCTKFYAVNDSDMLFCKECGQLLPIE